MSRVSWSVGRKDNRLTSVAAVAVLTFSAVARYMIDLCAKAMIVTQVIQSFDVRAPNRASPKSQLHRVLPAGPHKQKKRGGKLDSLSVSKVVLV